METEIDYSCVYVYICMYVYECELVYLVVVNYNTILLYRYIPMCAGCGNIIYILLDAINK